MNKNVYKVAIFCHDYSLSGANMSLLDWITSANREKFQFICVIPRKGERFEEICKNNNIPVIIGNYTVPLKELYKRQRSLKMVLKEKVYEYIKNPRSLSILRKKLSNMKIDMIHSNSFAITHGVKIAKQMRIPHIWHIREFMEDDHRISHVECPRKIKNFCKYSHAIFISDVIKQKYSVLFEKNKQNVIYNKIKYDKLYNKERSFGENNFYHIMIAGTLSTNKGQMDAIKAIEELKRRNICNMKLYICGIGYDEGRLKDYVGRNNLQNYVEFKGQVNNLVEMRKQMDIALVCSKSEALGRVTVEAMYYQNLVIGADAGFTPFIITDKKTGFLYQQGDYIDLSNKIQEAMNSKEIIDNILKEAREYSLDKFYNVNYDDKIYEVYESVMKSKRNKKTCQTKEIHLVGDNNKDIIE